jgi:retron-type reverse transcriptase
VDGVTFQEYEENLEANLNDLVGRLKRKAYRARLVRRKYIPKGPGKFRPLGIPVLEDKLLQVAVTQILLAIYEVDFLPCSYGYRPGLSAHDAIKALTDELQFGGHHFVVEADIKGFFDHLRWEWLERMLEQRIADGAFLNLIRKWLPSNPSADRNTAGRGGLARAGQYLSTLRVGPVDGTRGATATTRTLLDDPLRG